MIFSVRLWGPLLRFEIGLLLEKLHCDPEGRPEPHASETDSGYGPVGVTVNVYVPWSPASIVWVLGVA